MPKLDKSKYTKQEYKALKLLGKNSKQVTQKYNIVCVKHGEKYPSDYANILYRMCKRNCTLDFTFTCLTDNPKGLDANINVVALPEGYTGWWAKPFMFSNDTGLTGTILYLDLDVVISNNIDKLFTYKPDRWCIIRDFLRAQRSTWQKYNSSVIRFNSGQLQAMYKDFDIHKQTILKRFRGDQDYIYAFYIQLIVIAIFLIIGITNSFNTLFYLSLFVSLLFILYQRGLAKHRIPFQCISAFENNNLFGLTITFGLIFNYIFVS